jgi:uncharacterized protein (DUF1499 family)
MNIKIKGNIFKEILATSLGLDKYESIICLRQHHQIKQSNFKVRRKKLAEQQSRDWNNRVPN